MGDGLSQHRTSKHMLNNIKRGRKAFTAAGTVMVSAQAVCGHGDQVWHLPVLPLSLGWAVGLGLAVPPLDDTGAGLRPKQHVRVLTRIHSLFTLLP
jgi:hypothetical protein